MTIVARISILPSLPFRNSSGSGEVKRIEEGARRDSWTLRRGRIWRIWRISWWLRPGLTGWRLLRGPAIWRCGCRARRVTALGWLLSRLLRRRLRRRGRGFAGLRSRRGSASGAAFTRWLDSLRLCNAMARHEPDDDADKRETDQEKAEEYAAADWVIGYGDGSPASGYWRRGSLKQWSGRRLRSGSGLWSRGWLWGGRRLRGSGCKRRARWQWGASRRYGRLRRRRRRRCRGRVCPSGSGARLGCGSCRLSELRAHRSTRTGRRAWGTLAYTRYAGTGRDGEDAEREREHANAHKASTVVVMLAMWIWAGGRCRDFSRQ